MAKARLLEIPVFTLMAREMAKKLGKPHAENLSGDVWKVVWRNSHAWKLEYATRPQVSVTGDKLPDFLVERDDEPRLGVEVKNWALTSKWSYLTGQRDILDRFNWLPDKCDRVLLTTHLDAKTGHESAKISSAMARSNILVEKLGSVVGPEGLNGNKLYRNIAPRVKRWLAFIHKRNPKKRAAKRGQQRITRYTQAKRSRP
jgi:hypothetical protein